MKLINTPHIFSATTPQTEKIVMPVAKGAESNVAGDFSKLFAGVLKLEQEAESTDAIEETAEPELATELDVRNDEDTENESKGDVGFGEKVDRNPKIIESEEGDDFTDVSQSEAALVSQAPQTETPPKTARTAQRSGGPLQTAGEITAQPLHMREQASQEVKAPSGVDQSAQKNQIVPAKNNTENPEPVTKGIEGIPHLPKGKSAEVQIPLPVTDGAKQTSQSTPNLTVSPAPTPEEPRKRDASLPLASRPDTPIERFIAENGSVLSRQGLAAPDFRPQTTSLEKHSPPPAGDGEVGRLQPSASDTGANKPKKPGNTAPVLKHFIEFGSGPSVAFSEDNGFSEAIHSTRESLSQPGHRFEIVPGALSPTASGPVPVPAESVRQAAANAVEILIRQPGKPVEVSLNPEELGRVRMSLSTTDTVVTVAISSERPETLDLLRRHIDQLAEEFKKLGYESASFEFTEDAPNGRNQNTDAHSSAQGQTKDASPSIPTNSTRLVSTGLDLRL